MSERVSEIREGGRKGVRDTHRERGKGKNERREEREERDSVCVRDKRVSM